MAEKLNLNAPITYNRLRFRKHPEETAKALKKYACVVVVDGKDFIRLVDRINSHFGNGKDAAALSEQALLDEGYGNVVIPLVDGMDICLVQGDEIEGVGY